MNIKLGIDIQRHDIISTMDYLTKVLDTLDECKDIISRIEKDAADKDIYLML